MGVIDLDPRATATAICYVLDRLTRQPRLLEDWIAADWRDLAPLTANGDADRSTDDGRMYACIKAAVVRAEMERKGEGQAAAQHDRARQVRTPTGVVFGPRYGIVYEMTSIAVWNCADENMSYADQEVQSIESHRSGKVDVVVVGRALKWDKLGDFIASVKPTIFHFIGHGTPRGELIVNEETGTAARSIESVLKVVRAASTTLEGVYLSGCYTSVTGPEPLEILAPSGGWVVGTSDAVDDEVATMFTRKFYEHLFASNLDVKNVFSLAKAYLGADVGDTPHRMWMALSSMPPVDTMAQTIFTSLRGVFDRGAMQVPMRNEFSIAELDHALQDISHALGTGELLARRTPGPIARVSFPAVWLYEPRIADFVSEARRSIATLRLSLDMLQKGAGGEDRVIGNMLNFDPSVSRAIWMRRVNKVDDGRNKIIKAVNKLLNSSQVTPLERIPMSFSRRVITRTDADEQAAPQALVRP